MDLSITHEFGSDGCAELDVREARKAAPHDGVARRRVAGTREIATQSRDLDQIARYGSGMGGGRILVGKEDDRGASFRRRLLRDPV